MKRGLLTFALATMFVALTSAQDTLIFDEFTGNASSGIGTATGQTDVGSGISVISYENDQLKSDFTWVHSDWFPRAVWYNFKDYQNVAATPFLVVKFMVTDNDNDTIPVRLDLFGDGAQKYNDTIRTQMETNGNPWTLKAVNGKWYTVASNFSAENRFYCSYWNGGIPATRVDSTKIKGFEAFSHYGDAKYNGQAGTLFIDYLMMVSDTNSITPSDVLFGEANAFGLAVYPNPASANFTINAENNISNVDVYDMTGRTVLQLNNVNATIQQINTADMSTGLYFVKVTDINGNAVSKKLMLK